MPTLTTPAPGGPILGIDFGTTNTTASFFDRQGKLRLVPVKDRTFTLPSVVWFRALDKPVVGHAARMQIIDAPRATIHGAKRFLGRRFSSEFVGLNRDRVGYALVEGPDGLAAVEVEDQVVPLTDVVSHVLRQILDLANQAAGERIRECVLAVPALAGLRQREALRQAAAKAGLRVRALMNEATAAALHYAGFRGPEQQALVVALGGGTLDATLVSVKSRVAQVLASGGDLFLGGADFDQAIVDSILREFEWSQGIDLRDSPAAMQRLVLAAEGAKVALSTQESVRLRVPGLAEREGKFVDFDIQLRRDEVEAVVAPLVERVAAACDEVLGAALTSAEHVDELVLIGGQARMPAVRRRFSTYKRNAAEAEANPDMAVSIGAAVVGRNLGRGALSVQDVVPLPVSVQLPSGRVVEVIPANTPVPVTRRVAVGELPMTPGPLVLGLVEATDAVGLDHEPIGSITVPTAWRRAMASGNPQVELSVGADFSLSAKLVPGTGGTVDAPVGPPAPQ